jgi:hypothetical protein
METVNKQQMKSTLEKLVGSKFPAKFTLINGDVLVRYIRGYADQQTNILLVSETSYSLAMQILEVKDIAILEYGQSASGGQWVTLHAKWAAKRR